MAPSRRQFLALAGASASAAVLAGCGGGVLPEPDTAVAGFGRRASGTLQMWCRAATQTGVQVIVDAFEKSQDRIRVALTPVPDGQYVTKLATAIRGRRVPDLVDIDDINSSLFALREAFTDVTDLLAALPYADQLSPGHLGLARRAGRTYAVPFLSDNSVLWSDDALLEKAGVDPASLTDFDGMLAAARAVKAAGGIGLSIPLNQQGILGFVVQPHVWATGSRTIVGELGAQHAEVAGNDAVRRTLELYRTLHDEDLLQPGAAADAGTAWGQDFARGGVGLFPSSYGAVVPAAGKGAADRISVRLLPGPDGGTAFFDGGDNVAIPRGAQNASAAWEFVRFALDLPQQQKLPEGGYTPVRADANTPEFAARFPLAVPTLENLKAGYAPVTLGYNLLFNQPDSPWIAMVRRAVLDGDVDGAMAEGQAGFQRIIDQAQR